MRESLEEAFSDISTEHCVALSSRSGVGYGYPTNAFPYISLHTEGGFQRVLPFLKRGMSVVDVGCGAGDKLLRFNEYRKGMRITGIEIDPVMAKVARYVSRQHRNINVIEGNAFAQDYSQFDLIYMYWPIPNRERQADLQQLCVQTMKCGARLIVFGMQRSGDYVEMPSLDGYGMNNASQCGWVKP